MTSVLHRALRALLVLCIAIPGGFILMWPLGFLFDLLEMPGLLHGAAIVAWPMLSAAVFIVCWPLLGWAQRRLRERRATTDDGS